MNTRPGLCGISVAAGGPGLIQGLEPHRIAVSGTLAHVGQVLAGKLVDALAIRRGLLPPGALQRHRTLDGGLADPHPPHHGPVWRAHPHQRTIHHAIDPRILGVYPQDGLTAFALHQALDMPVGAV